MNAGGPCIGCTMPGFPDKFSPFLKTPPGSLVSSNASRLLGSIMRPLRRTSQSERNREERWHRTVPSGWAMDLGGPSLSHKILEFFYNKLQFKGSVRLGHAEFPGGYQVPARYVYGDDYQKLPEDRVPKRAPEVFQ